MSLMPCFKPGEAYEEGIIIGRLLAGYGEIELVMCACLIAIEGQFDTPIREIFLERGAETRIKKGRKLLMTEYTKASLQDKLSEALEDMEWCRQIRNQYADCHWYWTSKEGLCFVNLEDLAKQPTMIIELMAGRRPIDQSLETQENFFNYVKETFTHIESAYRAWNVARSAPRRPTHVFAMPSKISRPPLHN
jgi:hypothetical protein